MNTALFIANHNKTDILKFATELADKQRTANRGKLLIAGAYYLDEDVLKEIAELLEDTYEVVEIVKTQVSEGLAEHTQISTSFAHFLMQRYTSVPGPWLIVDGYAEVVELNPLSIIEKAHNAGNNENSGRSSLAVEGRGRVPIGPVVIGTDVKKIRSLRSATGEDWRQRGRYAFEICSWSQLSADEYPFRIAAAIEAPAETDNETVDLPVPIKIENAKKNDLPIALPRNDAPAPEPFSPKKVESTEVSSVQQRPKPFVRMDPSYYPKAEKAELMEQVHKRTGKKPHHFTKEPKLIETLKNLDTAPV